jgi:hypothetical protein
MRPASRVLHLRWTLGDELENVLKQMQWLLVEAVVLDAWVYLK